MATLIVAFLNSANIPKSERSMLMTSRRNKKENARFMDKQNSYTNSPFQSNSTPNIKEILGTSRIILIIYGHENANRIADEDIISFRSDSSGTKC
jgi:hypothetical protein